MSDKLTPDDQQRWMQSEVERLSEAQYQSELAPAAGSAAPDVPVLSILKRHLETSVHYQQVASKIGNPEGYAYVKIPDWEVRQIIEHLERQNDLFRRPVFSCPKEIRK